MTKHLLLFGKQMLSDKPLATQCKRREKKIHHESRKPESGTSDLFSLDKDEASQQAPYGQSRAKGTGEEGQHTAGNSSDRPALHHRPAHQSSASAQPKWKMCQMSSLKGIHYRHQFYPGILLLRMVIDNSFICILIYLIHPSSVQQLESQEMNRNLNAKKFKLCQQ